KIIREAQTLCRQHVATVKAKCCFEPRHGLCGSARPDQNVSSCLVTIGIAWIDLERTIDLSQRQIIPSFVIVDGPKQAVGAGRCRIESERFLCERFGLVQLIPDEFGPS